MPMSVTRACSSSHRFEAAPWLFDGGRLTSNAGAPLLGAVDRVIGLSEKLAVYFSDARNSALVEHAVGTLMIQHVVGIALG